MPDFSHKTVLVVDDSAYNRRTVAEILRKSIEGVEIVTARDGEEGLKMVRETHPAVITLDLEMPRMDGFTFLRLAMAYRPTPTIVVSAKNDERSLIKALELGAMDFISKPTQQASTRLKEVGEELVEKVKVALGMEFDAVKRRNEILQSQLGRYQPAAEKLIGSGEYVSRLLLIGASTGGPAAIHNILGQIEFPRHLAVVIAQHMPAGFTSAFAARLNRSLPLEVREVTAIEPLNGGAIYLARGGRNLQITSREGRPYLASIRPKAQSRFVPSVDILFESAAAAFNRRMLGLVLTGMGNDGTLGARAIRGRNHPVLVESEKTAIVFGMPRSIIDHHLASEILALDDIPGYITEWLTGKSVIRE